MHHKTYVKKCSARLILGTNICRIYKNSGKEQLCLNLEVVYLIILYFGVYL